MCVYTRSHVSYVYDLLPQYYKVSRDASISTALRNKVIIEYPTIHVMSKEQADQVHIAETPAEIPSISPDAIAASTGVR